uniref:Uncharacterized protein n=1 Tax=Nelumbo nucifera TaxID=4432 RepID=A0A822YBC9_NELNU|nr:TPA_asm: hypothetical protein HUJ06_030077 [Nelumbo nucifera]
MEEQRVKLGGIDDLRWKNVRGG